jgi:hypothetical protein
MPPNRAVHAWTLCGGIVISQRAFTAFLFWVAKISGFQKAKTSANKRFLIMSAKSIRLCDCKGSELFWIEQEKLHFGVFFFGTDK